MVVSDVVIADIVMAIITRPVITHVIANRRPAKPNGDLSPYLEKANFVTRGKFIGNTIYIEKSHPSVVMETNDHQVPSQIPPTNEAGKCSGFRFFS